jgi:tetratricopeptide (TPR) repeat protein
MARGKFEEAERQLLFALKREPLLLAANLAPARLLHYRRQYQAAIRQANKVLEMDAGFHPAYVVIGQAYERLNQHREAIEALKRAGALAPSNSEVTAALAHAYGRSGDRRAAEKLLRDLQSFSRTRRISPVDFAVIHIGLGQTSEALNQLDRAYEDRDGRLVQLKVNPVYDSMHSEARYRALLKRINLER